MRSQIDFLSERQFQFIDDSLIPDLRINQIKFLTPRQCGLLTHSQIYLGLTDIEFYKLSNEQINGINISYIKGSVFSKVCDHLTEGQKTVWVKEMVSQCKWQEFRDCIRQFKTICQPIFLHLLQSPAEESLHDRMSYFIVSQYLTRSSLLRVDAASPLGRIAIEKYTHSIVYSFAGKTQKELNEWVVRAIKGDRNSLFFQYVSLELLESYCFPTFRELLESTNNLQVKLVSKFLMEKFIMIPAPKISIESEIGQTILHKYILSHATAKDKRNPYTLFQNIYYAHQKSLPVKLPSFNGYQLNLGYITAIAKSRVFNLTYGELKAVLGRELINPEELRAWFSGLKNRLGDTNITLIDTKLAEMGLRSLDALEHTVCIDEESLRWQRIGDDAEKAPDVTIQLNACLSSLLLRAIPPTSPEEPLSETELAILKFINVFIYCPSGRIEQLRTMYSYMQDILPTPLKQTQGDYLTNYLYDIYLRVLENLLFRSTRNPHEIIFLTNLLGFRLGLPIIDITFDPHSHSISAPLVEKPHNEIFQELINELSSEDFIITVQKRLIADLEHTSPIAETLGAALKPLFTTLGHKMGYYYEEVVSLTPTDPIKERISLDCAREALLLCGLLTKSPSTDRVDAYNSPPK